MKHKEHDKHLSRELNDKVAWAEARDKARRRIEVDIDEVEKVIELARRTPGLTEYESQLRQLSIFFNFSTQFYQEFVPDKLPQLVKFWERYRAAVVQRYTSITPVELRAADKVVNEIFKAFLKDVPDENKAYSADAVPLVYGGEGGLNAYSTNPPEWNRPFAIINLPHTAFDNVWQWLALAHETGHNTYKTIDGLEDELKTALDNEIEDAFNNGKIELPEVTVNLKGFRQSHQVIYEGIDFIKIIWRSWAEEAQADIVSLLSCGGASIISLQQIIGFEEKDSWTVYFDKSGISHGPEEHPTAYIRNVMNIEALRLMCSKGHNALAEEINDRFNSLKPATDQISWFLNKGEELAAQVSLGVMEASAKVVAKFLLTHPFKCLDSKNGKGKSYEDLICFTKEDQDIVYSITEELIRGYPTFAQREGANFRHALAATIFAFEKKRSEAELINRTFKHFCV